MKVARYTMMIGLLLAFAGMATLACASEAEPALDEAQMRSIVQEAVAKSAPAPQPQVSAEEIKSMVESAMPMAPEPGFSRRDQVNGGIRHAHGPGTGFSRRDQVNGRFCHDGDG